VFDCHSHILPGIDDGASDLQQSLEMAKIALAEGITSIACTSHITPGVYNNSTETISAAMANLQTSLLENDLPLKLVIGADVHISPNIVPQIAAGLIPTLGNSRYLLLEFSHHQMTPGLEQLAFEIVSAGYVPVLTHPERLSWIEEGFPLFRKLAQRGCWIQITAGAITGKFGRRAEYWATKFLSDGLTHVIATDAHNPKRRPPLIQEAINKVAELVGAEEKDRIVFDRPSLILTDCDPATIPAPIGLLRRPKTGQGIDPSTFGVRISQYIRKWKNV